MNVIRPRSSLGVLARAGVRDSGGMPLCSPVLLDIPPKAFICVIYLHCLEKLRTALSSRLAGNGVFRDLQGVAARGFYGWQVARDMLQRSGDSTHRWPGFVGGSVKIRRP